MSDIPFSFFVSLLREISRHSRPRKTGTRRDKHHPALDVLRNWIARLRSDFMPVPAGTAARVFRMLFPEEDTRRKYDMQETRLAAALADCFAVERLREWRSDGLSGCLGEEVLKVLDSSSSFPSDSIGPLSIADVDRLLDELASHSGFSHSSVRSKYPHATRRPRSVIIRELYRSLPPQDASFLTQIILKDLRPLLYPLSETHFTVALKSFNSVAITQLTKESAMEAWDPSRRMLEFYRVRSDLDDASAAFEAGITTPVTPRIGTPVDIPKSEKGRGCLHALSMLRTAQGSSVWAETKYDGERTQIHVEILDGGHSRITIFSKSKRDSTMDRHGIHELIRNALGLCEQPRRCESLCQVKANVILDAEMIAWHGGKIDEFWRIHTLVEHTAVGVRHQTASNDTSTDNYSQVSLMTDVSGNRHLGLVFFDILMLDSTSLLSTPYSSRRAILESVIKPIPGHAILAERQRIALTPNDQNPSLNHIFAQCIASPEEGLVLKAGEASYNDKRLPWVKLKRDYIPGYGDCVDLVVLGVAWEKDRARELRVAPNTYTTFYIGGLHNAEQLQREPEARPHFYIHFTAAYGLSREELEEANFLIKASDTVPYNSSGSTDLPFTYHVSPSLVPPSRLLREPLLAELFGAGFTKSPRSRHYELRFPRINKIFRKGERSWRDGVCLQDLYKIARDSLGKDRSDKDVDDWGNRLWGKQVSPSVAMKRKGVSDEWEERLIAADRNFAKRQGMMTPVHSRSLPLGSRTNLEESMVESPHLSSGPPVPTNLEGFLALEQEPDPIPQSTSAKQRDSISDVLSGSLVFVATQNPTLRRHWRLKIPPGRFVHSLESLFIGCGWSSKQAPDPWVQRGVIVLDDSEHSVHRRKVLDAVNERKLLCRNLPGRKAIQVLQRNPESC